MAKVNWIKGNTPPTSGEYYIILEAQKDLADFNKGDIEITDDYYNAEFGEFNTLGENNEFWKVLAWADMIRPDVPDLARKKLKSYFGSPVSEDWRDQAVKE